jgi:restriction endonuclease S subunit
MSEWPRRQLPGDPAFIFYALGCEKQRILFLAQGSGQPNLSKQIIDNLRISIPPRSYQSRVAEIAAALFAPKHLIFTMSLESPLGRAGR